MKRQPNFVIRLATNCAGFGILILGLIVAPIPGPGGTPLLLLGLGILSLNNHWASRLRRYVIDQHQSLSHLLFPANPWMIFIWDLIGAVLFGASLSVIVNVGGRWGYIIASPIMTIALLIWASNHRRGQRIYGWLRQGWRRWRNRRPAD